MHRENVQMMGSKYDAVKKERFVRRKWTGSLSSLCVYEEQYFILRAEYLSFASSESCTVLS